MGESSLVTASWLAEHDPGELVRMRSEGDLVHLAVPTGERVPDPLRPGETVDGVRIACDDDLDFVSISSTRADFADWEAHGVACPACVEWVHA